MFQEQMLKWLHSKYISSDIIFCHYSVIWLA